MKIVHNITKLIERRKELRNKSTPEEILLWLRLKNSQTGFKFRRQHSIGGYIADFYCPSKKLIIEIDGPQHLKNKEYDKIRSDYNVLKRYDLSLDDLEKRSWTVTYP